MRGKGVWNRRMRHGLLVAAVGAWSAICCGCGGGGGGAKTWEATFGGTGDDRGTSVRQTSDGGYVVAGDTDSFGAGGYDMYLVRIDSDGNLVWEQTYGGSGFDRALSVQQTSDGGYVLAGDTGPFGPGDHDIYLVLTDSAGDSARHRIISGGGNDEAASIQQTSDGGYIVAGATDSFGAGEYDMFLVKTDSDGGSEWYRPLGGTGYDVGTSVQQTSDGGYIVAGYTDSFGAGDLDMYLVKTDADGILEWQRLFGGTNRDAAFSVQQTSDGGYILAGTTESSGAGGRDMYLVKTNSDGNLEWHKTFGGTGGDEADSVQQTSDGGYILAGTTESSGAGGRDMYLVKTNSDGNLEWQNTFGGTGSDGAFSVRQTDDGGYIVAGVTDSFGAGGDDVYLVKTDGNGNL